MKTVKEMVNGLMGKGGIEVGGIVNMEGMERVNPKDYMNKHTSSLYTGDKLIEDAKKLTGLMKINGLMMKMTSGMLMKEFFNPVSELREIFELYKQGHVSHDDMDNIIDLADKFVDNFQR